jgi:predicted transcriptional regulator
MPTPDIPAKIKRKPRFARVADVHFRLQERDIEIIKAVYKHRFLTSSQVIALVPGSEKGLLRRLHYLYHAGFVDRPKEQIRPYRNGSNVFVYAIGNRGADLLHYDFGLPRSKVDWTTKNREVKSIYLEHGLLVSNFKVILEVACQRNGNIQIIEPERNAGRDSVLPVNIQHNAGGNVKNYSFSLTPDGVFGLNFINEPDGRNKAHFILEADRSTMPIKRKDFFRSSFERKIIGYWDCWQKGIFKKMYGFEKARILTLAISKERIASMVKACKEVDPNGKGASMFLFSLTNNFTLENCDNALKQIWQNGYDDRIISLAD